MNKDLTELVMILDASGSMHSLTADTIGGFNSMIEKQKKEDGQCLVTTVQFNHGSRTIHDRLPLDRIPVMTDRDYVASGSTALVDAMGSTIEHIADIHRYIRTEDVPAHTIFVIITDGMENASRTYSSDQVKRLVKAKQEAGWEFLFIGANIDSVETAARFNISADSAVDFVADSRGMGVVMEAVSAGLKDRRAGRRSSEWRACIQFDKDSRE